MFSRFFIDRPIFASVLSIVITLGGSVAVFSLPVTQYPDITPPTVEVSAIYAGANAQVVADTIAAPVEQQVNGVEGMMYMTSQSTNDGAYALTITFKPGTDLNMAQVLVQNRVSLAQPVLPAIVQRRGVTVKKKSPSQLMIINLFSPDGSRDSLYLSNFATIKLRDELSRLPGVGDITFLGQRDYSMRIWLDPDRMAVRGLSAADVTGAIEQQNAQVAAGQIGQPPAPTGQSFQYTMSTLGRLESEEQFANMVLKADSGGRLIRLGDVAKVELGALAYDQACMLDGKPSVALSVYQLPGSNAMETARAVRAKMEQLKRDGFKEGVDFAIVYDTTPFIQESINEVFKSLRDAVILVAVVVLVFLQGWRAAVIPLVAVPVAIVGTFAAMVAVGFSLNTLTLFGLVLAIGIVVDDAIVVVEAIEHQLEEGHDAREAAIIAMDQVAGPVVAIGLVLTAVFIPCTFISGIIGQFFRQFALTIAISTLISCFNSLTLSPALAVLLLQPRKEGKRADPLPRVAIWFAAAWAAYSFLGPMVPWAFDKLHVQPPAWVAANAKLIAGLAGLAVGLLLAGVFNSLLAMFFKVFNTGFKWVTEAYVAVVALSLKLAVLVLVAYAGLLFATEQAFVRTPTGFIPQQDKGYLLVNVRLPDSASLDRTNASMRTIEEICRRTKGVAHTVSVSGQSILLAANAPNFGTIYVMLDDFHHRAADKLSADVLADEIRREIVDVPDDSVVTVFGAPPIEGLGTAGGFKIVIEDRGNQGLAALQQVAEKVVEQGSEDDKLRGLFSSFRADTTWLHLDVDRWAARTMGVSLGELFGTLQTEFGSLYVNDFNRFGRTWQVNVQATPAYRMAVDDLKRLRVRNDRNEMAPLGSVIRPREISGPVMLVRYNLYTAAAVNADAAPGASSSEAIAKVGDLAEQSLLQGMKTEWTELALLQLQAGNTALYAFLLAVVLVFLVLAAQYESWALPLAVILVVPMCLLCSILGVRASKMDVNIFTQIGFVVLVGLACKNAILIVEFARAERERGKNAYDATLEACRLRLRPIIMTSFAFILGVVPLMVGEGAGAEMRQTLGTAVFWGMLGVTAFGIFLTPVFYYVIQLASDWIWPAAPRPDGEAGGQGIHGPQKDGGERPDRGGPRDSAAGDDSYAVDRAHALVPVDTDPIHHALVPVNPIPTGDR